MNDEWIKQKVRAAATSDVPDLREVIKANPRFRVPRKSSYWSSFRFQPLQFASILLVLLVSGWLWLNPVERIEPVIYATIYLDINPSFEIDIDEDYEILTVRAMNIDAQHLLSGIEALRGKNLDVGFDRLVERAIALEYLSSTQPVMMLDVSAKEVIERASVLNHLKARVPDLRASLLPDIEIIEGDARNQSTEETEMATTHAISVMRVRLIREIMAFDKTYTFEKLSVLEMVELRQLLEHLRAQDTDGNVIDPGTRPDSQEEDGPSTIRPPAQENESDREDDTSTSYHGMGNTTED